MAFGRRDEAFVCFLVLKLPPGLGRIPEVDLLVTGAVEYDFFDPFRQLGPRRGEIEVIVSGQPFEYVLRVPGVYVADDAQRALGDRAVRCSYQQGGINLRHRPQALTFGAHADRPVE